MGYIEKNLLRGEVIKYEAQLHWLVYAGPFLVAILAIGLAVAASHFDYTSIGLFVAALILIAVAAWCLEINGGKRYVVTTKRVIFKKGFIKRSSYDLMLHKCEGVMVEQSIMGRIFNYGTVIVTTGEASNSYKFISHPFAFSTSINQQIDDNIHAPSEETVISGTAN